MGNIMYAKYCDRNKDEIWSKLTSKDISEAINGAVKIICGVCLGLIICIYGLSCYRNNMSLASTESIYEMNRQLIYIFSVGGYVWLISRGISQIRAIFKANKGNIAVAFWADVFALICIVSSCINYFLNIADNALKYSCGETILYIYLSIYMLSIVITLTDAVILLINIKTQQSKVSFM